nr:hypothetical protein [Tanacetum cinerariifolium]
GSGYNRGRGGGSGSSGCVGSPASPCCPFKVVTYACKAITYPCRDVICPSGLAAAADELSPTSYLGPREISNLFRGGKVTSGLSSLRLAEGSYNGGEWEVEEPHLSVGSWKLGSPRNE